MSSFVPRWEWPGDTADDLFMSHGLLNLPVLVLKARHLSGSAFRTGIIYRCSRLIIGMASPRSGLVLEDDPFERWVITHHSAIV